MSLSSTINDIFAAYEPLSSVEKHFFNEKSDDIQNIVKEKTSDLSETEKKRIEDEIYAWGPLESLKNRDDILEILINGPQFIFIETVQGLVRWDDYFLSDQSFFNFTEELFKKAKLLISHNEPCANGFIDGFRVHVTSPPVSKEINITLRKHRTQVFPLNYYKDSNFSNEQQFEKVLGILKNKKNFLVIGPTGSGKTTFLNSLINSLPHNERCLIIEDTDEIHCPEGASTKLLTREVGPENLKPILMGDLVKQSLRMRPDRIVIGEVRGAEAKDLLLSLATGHSGSIGTLHAQSAQQAIYRLEMLIQMGAPQWNLMAIRRLILMSLNYLIVLKEDRYNKGIEGIYKICSLEDFGLLLNKEC